MKTTAQAGLIGGGYGAAVLVAWAAVAIHITCTSDPAAQASSGRSAFAVPRILVAPLFAELFFLSGLFAPGRASRVALLSATAIEAAVFGCFAFRLLHSAGHL